MKRAFNQGYLLLKGLRKVKGEVGFTMLAYDMRPRDQRPRDQEVDEFDWGLCDRPVTWYGSGRQIEFLHSLCSNQSHLGSTSSMRITSRAV